MQYRKPLLTPHPGWAHHSPQGLSDGRIFKQNIMNAKSSASSNSWVNKAILVVLVLCLACLGFIIYQNNLRRWEEERRAELWLQRLAEKPNNKFPSRRTSVNAAYAVDEAPAWNPIEESDAPEPPDEPVPAPVVIAEERTVSEYLVPVAVATDNFAHGESHAPVGSATTNGVYGRVSIVGELPPERVVVMDPVCQRLSTGVTTTQFYRAALDGGLADVVVYVDAPDGGFSLPKPPEPAVLDNVNCWFEPYVMAVQAGQKVLLRNSDAVVHNFHLTFSNNPHRNMAALSNSPDRAVTFHEPELFGRVKCDVHPWMFAYISVFPHPYFAVTDTNGLFRLPPGLPPARYTLAAHHRKAGRDTKVVEVIDMKPLRVDFTLRVPDREN